ncbi:MAG: hypothetical protein R3E83_17835 [Burkholderiaceae bacterium]
MGLKKLAAKLAEYNERLERGAASKIEADHVRQVLEKLRRKEASLLADVTQAEDEFARTRLERKLGIARDQIARAQWLLGEIS